MQGTNNVLFTLNRTTHSSKTLLCVVRINVNKTLEDEKKVETSDVLLLGRTMVQMRDTKSSRF